MTARVVLLDVEGVTTPVDFVYKTLFPYARERVESFLAETWDDPATRADVAQLRADHAAETCAKPPWRADVAGVTAFVLWLMDQDRKSTGLKSLQGRIWERGYFERELRGAVYPDVPRSLERWTRRGLRVAIFSSGSVLAQQLLFKQSSAGDLSRYLSGHFDTTTGPKRAAASYTGIASALDEPAEAVLFVSDTPAELDAAREAGMQTALCAREDLPSAGAGYRVVRSLDELL